MSDTKNISHTKWNGNTSFLGRSIADKFSMARRKELQENYCENCVNGKGIVIIEAECCPDHIHMLVEIPPKLSVSSFVEYLKGKIHLMIYEQFGELKFNYSNREFWCRG